MDSSDQPVENRWNQIDRYVNGEMIEDELRLFEERMRDHAELAQQVHLHRDVLEGMEFYFMQQLKNQLAISDQKKKKVSIRLILQIAAVVLLVAGLAGAAYYYLLRPTNPQQVFLTYFEAYPNRLEQTNRGEPASDEASAEVSAMQHYEAGNFSEAATALTDLVTSDSVEENRTVLLFYRGVAHLGAGQTAEAIGDLTTVVQNTDSLLAEPATWYLGLGYLQAGQLNKAKELLIQLRDTGGGYADQATKLLDDLV